MSQCSQAKIILCLNPKETVHDNQRNSKDGGIYISMAYIYTHTHSKMCLDPNKNVAVFLSPLSLCHLM